VLTRDGQSTYLINNQVVRRKDVHDMFLGTGLGPRAYAIIGQGTISKLIEAKPEELRVFLEEAAGVSKYKERRRETESRLADTRENLLRVEDIVRELALQIEKLERQAEVAKQYRELEADRDTKQRMLWLVRRDEAGAEQARIAQQLAELQLQLDSRLADQRHAESLLEQTRTAHYQAGDDVHRAQAAYYEAGSEVSRLESEIRFVADSQAQLRDRIASLSTQASAAAQRASDSGDSLAQSDEELAGAEEREAVLAAMLEAANERLPALEEALRERRDALERARTLVTETSQQIQVLATRQRAIEDAVRGLQDRQARLRDELHAVGEAPVAELETLRGQLAEAESLEHAAGERVVDAEARWSDLDAKRMPAQHALREALAQVARVDARIAALRQIQERVRNEGKTKPWLERHGLAQLRPLWQRLRIESGWETAIESVLRERVQSLEVGRLQAIGGLLGEQPPAKVGFHSPAAAVPGLRTEFPAGLVPLARQVHCNDPQVQALVEDWLHGAFAAETADGAMADRERLPPGGRFVLRSGHAIGRYGVHLYAMDSEE
jgi:chromosome segregation protein